MNYNLGKYLFLLLHRQVLLRALIDLYQELAMCGNHQLFS